MRKLLAVLLMCLISTVSVAKGGGGGGHGGGGHASSSHSSSSGGHVSEAHVSPSEHSVVGASSAPKASPSSSSSWFPFFGGHSGCSDERRKKGEC